MNTVLRVPDNNSRPIVGIDPDDDRDERREAAYDALIKDGYLPDGRDVSAIHALFMNMEQGELMELADAVNDANDYATLSVGRRIGEMLNKAAHGEINKVVV